MIPDNLFTRLEQDDYEEILVAQNRASGLRAFLVIHDTTFGPAHGGTRTLCYSSDREALEDALLLARAMTYKAALAGIPAGGGKIVVLDHPRMERQAAFRALGRFVESLGGRFFTGGDMGTTAQDLLWMNEETSYVASEADPRIGDLAEATARGVFAGFRACLDVAGLEPGRTTVAIQGVGAVGYRLAELLREQGCKLVVADVNREAAERACRALGAVAVEPHEIYDARADVFAPCAVGGTVNPETVPRLRARIICGCANNVLADAAVGQELVKRDILYAPDYVVNAGGLIQGGNAHLLGKTDNREELEAIYGRTREILERARSAGRPTQAIADEMAQARLKRPKTYHEMSWPSSASHRRGW